MKKALQIIKNILIWAVVVFAVLMMVFTLITVSTVGKNDRTIFGYRFYIVLSDSMSATDFEAGDMVVIAPVDPADLQVGDIVAYIGQDGENFGKTITHKIRERVTLKNNEPAFITYGTTTGTDDEVPVTYPYILGKYTFRLPKIGKFFRFLKTTPGYIIFILTPFLILILYLGIRSIRLFKRYKQEQMNELQAEQKKVEEERAESERMLEELRRLKEELAKANALPENETAETPTEPEKHDEQ